MPGDKGFLNDYKHLKNITKMIERNTKVFGSAKKKIVATLSVTPEYEAFFFILLGANRLYEGGVGDVSINIRKCNQNNGFCTDTDFNMAKYKTCRLLKKKLKSDGLTEKITLTYFLSVLEGIYCNSLL